MTEPAEPPGASPLDSCPEAVISINSAGRIVRWNAAAAQLLGAAASERLGLPLASVVTLTPREPDHLGLSPERRWLESGPVRVPVEVLEWTAHDEGRPITHLLLRDATSRVAVEKESDRAAAVLRRQARFDAHRAGESVRARRAAHASAPGT
jgi:PAS domain S-box-containing protein